MSKAKFFGRVESIISEMAIVSLRDEITGEEFEAECRLNTLLQSGISDGDEFVCEILRDGPSVFVRFTRIEPKQISLERIVEIIAETSKDIGGML